MINKIFSHKKKGFKVFLLAVITLLAALVFLVLEAESVLLPPLITGVDTSPEYGDCIVVFGGGMIRGPKVRIGKSTRERLDLAVALYKTKKRPVLISDGSLYRKSPAIPLIKRYLVEKGVHQEDIIVEGASQTTFDNVRNSIRIAHEKGFVDLMICTSPYHQKRSQILLQKAKAVRFKMAVMKDSEVFSADDFSQKIRTFNLIFHEYAALVMLYVGGL